MQRNDRERLTTVGRLAARKLGYDGAAYLDSGGNGIAMLIGDNIVMKVTTDATEYVEASKVKGKKTKHLSDIYGIWAISNPDHKGTYIITKEMVDVGRDAKMKLDRAQKTLESTWTSTDMDTVTNETDAESFFMNYWHYHNQTMVPKAREALSDAPEEAVWYFDQMVGLLDEMKQFGLTGVDQFTEDHGNIGLKNGNMVYFDVGYGETKKNIEMHHLELENRKRLRNAVRDVVREIGASTEETFVSGL